MLKRGAKGTETCWNGGLRELLRAWKGGLKGCMSPYPFTRWVPLGQNHSQTEWQMDEMTVSLQLRCLGHFKNTTYVTLSLFRTHNMQCLCQFYQCLDNLFDVRRDILFWYFTWKQSVYQDEKIGVIWYFTYLDVTNNLLTAAEKSRIFIWCRVKEVKIVLRWYVPIAFTSSRAQPKRVINHNNILHALISNSRTAWRTKMLMPFFFKLIILK